MCHLYWCEEYESGYDSEYGGLYEQTFVFYDEEELDEDLSDFSDDQEDDDESEDIILEEIPFVHCPGQQETGVA